MKKIYVLDTNIILHNPDSVYGFDDNTVVVTGTTLQELDVKKDDIIVYNWTDETGAFLVSPNGNVRVVHRAVEIKQDENGNVSLITKGDNNVEDDKIPVTSHNFVGIYNHKTSLLQLNLHHILFQPYRKFHHLNKHYQLTILLYSLLSTF